jgi:hypothetical protein
MKMKWQDALSKTDLHHLRNMQDTLTLREFRVNREKQKRMEQQMRDEMGLHAPACPQCSSIELKLINAGIKV